MKPADEIKNTTPYLGYLDVMERPLSNPVKLTIAGVEDASEEKIDGVRPAKSGTYAISFKETPRKMVIQGRKKKHLMREFGKKASGWIDKQIQIYGDASVTFAGKKVGGIKIVGME